MTEVRDNPEKSRYELLEDGRLLGVADYRAMGETLAFPHTEIVPARPPITRQASPASAIIKFRASPIPQGIRTLQGQFSVWMSSEGIMLTTVPPAASARSAATRVAGLPHPLQNGTHQLTPSLLGWLRLSHRRSRENG